jgi:Tfp pilus assembly protein PilF
MGYLNQAIAIDPNYALAYSALAYNYINQVDWFMAPKVAAPKAKEAAQKALGLDESNAEAHVVLGIELQWYEWDWVGAEREFKRALDLNPDSAEAIGYYSWFLPIMGRGDEAIAEARRELQNGPTFDRAQWQPGFHLYIHAPMGQGDRAAAFIHRSRSELLVRSLFPRQSIRTKGKISRGYCRSQAGDIAWRHN